MSIAFVLLALYIGAQSIYVLAAAVLIGLVLNATVGWWWADPLAAFVIVYHGLREGRTALKDAAR